MHPLINIATKAARRASHIIIKALNNPQSIRRSEKAKKDIVTDVDVLVEREIIQTIQQVYPMHGIIAEESGKIMPQPKPETVWIIDPIDGTTNFSHGLPHFVISIAIEHRGVIEHGLIYDPSLDELFTASIGRGAQLNDKRIRVSNISQLSQSLVTTCFPPNVAASELTKQFATHSAAINGCGGVRCTGSAALDLAYIAAGRFDGMWAFPLKQWDMAAGALLVTEAGGFVTSYDASKNFLPSGAIIAGNPKIHPALLHLVNQSRQSVVSA